MISLIPHRKPCFTFGHRCGILGVLLVSCQWRESKDSVGSAASPVDPAPKTSWEPCLHKPTNSTIKSIRSTGIVAGRHVACQWLNASSLLKVKAEPEGLYLAATGGAAAPGCMAHTLNTLRYDSSGLLSRSAQAPRFRGRKCAAKRTTKRVRVSLVREKSPGQATSTSLAPLPLCLQSLRRSRNILPGFSSVTADRTADWLLQSRKGRGPSGLKNRLRCLYA